MTPYIAGSKLRSFSCVRKHRSDGVLGGMSCEASAQAREVLVGFQASEPLLGLQHSSSDLRRAITPNCQRFTFRVLRRIVPCIVTMALAQASAALSADGAD